MTALPAQTRPARRPAPDVAPVRTPRLRPVPDAVRRARAGVADPDPGYAHYKRRIDPAIPLGRPSGNEGDPGGG